MKESKARNNRIRRLLVLVLAVMTLVLSTAVPSYAGVKVSDLDGLRAGVMTGTPQDEIVKSQVRDVQVSYFNNFADLALALKHGKIDFFLNSNISYMMISKEYPSFITTDDSLAIFDIGAIFPWTDEGQALRDEFNEYLYEVKTDGTLQRLQDYWITAEARNPIELPQDGGKGVLRMATCSTMPPFSYVVDGEHAGYEVALVADFCRKNGYGLQIDDMDFNGVVSSIWVGKYDIAASQVSWTAERADNVLFSETYYNQRIVAVLDMNTNVFDENFGWLDEKTDSFKKTFLVESRWKMILHGMWNTVSITILAALFGTIIGYAICLLRKSKYRLLSISALTYIKIFQGTPIVVLLLIMYYVIFGHSQVPALWVAIAAFSLNFAAYSSEIMRSGIDSIDIGQTEAALALGYTPRKAFYNFVLPQAAVRFMPAMKGQIVSLLKGTAVIGYIAILDLSRAGDIIRSRTYEAFFPLVTTAIIYFILSWILTYILDKIEVRYNPRKKKAAKNKGEGVQK